MTERVIGILLEYTEMKEGDIAAKTNLITDMGLNSLDIVNVIMAFENEFDIEIPEEMIPEFVTVGAIVRYLEAHV